MPYPTRHEPSSDDMLQAANLLYPEADWKEVRVVREDPETGEEVVVQDASIVLLGDLSTQTVVGEEDSSGETDPMNPYGDAAEKMNDKE